MITLEISDVFRSHIDAHIIEETALTTLQHQSVDDCAELTIVITNDDQLQALNRQFLDIDAPTDVLSFPADFTDPENEAPYLGDIVISYQRAENQAVVGGHTLMAETQLLLIHGILHLLGYDHADSTEKSAMWSAQQEILYKLGLGSLKTPDSG